MRREVEGKPTCVGREGERRPAFVRRGDMGRGDLRLWAQEGKPVSVGRLTSVGRGEGSRVTLGVPGLACSGVLVQS